eukprot:Gregarina_sp_Poly_1__2313@NODE_1619_length_3701_cov_20_287562_g1066_i0_p3_GENE_NODE_1619_length_3701_cov_20_287562_g1066_i0NODE_1619_length_3701_cov_20_287562_g1066_i0_p3_ORF_typecomplete_len103_score11_482OGFeII_Oxy_2/PF13532_6/2_7e11_NODE_1619_length_3701_cov_20_287562_g1066_i022032511
MEFRRNKNGNRGAESDANEIRRYYLARRSLCIFKDEARYDWFHGIKSRKTDQLDDGSTHPRERRVSLTFRKLNFANDFQCACEHPSLCDTQNPASLQLPERI